MSVAAKFNGGFDELDALIALRVSAGFALVLAPAPILRRLTGDRRLCPGTLVGARLLGLRHLGEAAVLVRYRTPSWLLLGASVDGVHSLSMAALVLLSPRRRRPAAASAISGAAFACAGVLTVRRRRHRKTGG